MLIVVFALAICFAPVADGVKPQTWQVLAIFISAISLVLGVR